MDKRTYFDKLHQERFCSHLLSIIHSSSFIIHYSSIINAGKMNNE